MSVDVCKYCDSKLIVKNGIRKGLQRYLCKNCNHVFFGNGNSFARMRVNDHVIVTALNLYFEGLSVRKVSKQLEQIFGEQISQVTIWTWIQKYSKIVSQYVNSLSPKLSDSWHADELFVKMREGIEYQHSGNIAFLWNIMDRRTRFLLASKLSTYRDRVGAKEAFDIARKNAHGDYPFYVYTDAAGAYSPIRLSNATGWNINHIAKSGIRKPHANNNRIERLNGTLRERTKVQRGWKSMKTLIPEGQRIHYNFCRTHSALGMTPAQACGLAVKGWR